MGKDHKARAEITGLLIAWGNLVAALVMTMRHHDVGNDVIHDFLDLLEDANEALLDRRTLGSTQSLIEALRFVLPSND